MSASKPPLPPFLQELEDLRAFKGGVLTLLAANVMAAQKIKFIVDRVENRCMAADGPVTPTLREMREDELAELWEAACVIAASAG